MGRHSNYEVMKRDALERFLTYDQSKILKRLQLESDDTFLYIDFCGYAYRVGRRHPLIERRTEGGWQEAGFEEVLSLCDLMCHTDKPIVLDDDFVSLKSLNRVQGGNMKTTLASGMFRSAEKQFDGKDESLSAACETLGGIRVGKGDVAYEIPLTPEVHCRIAFYDSDDEFAASLTVLFPRRICDFLHYETLYYVTGFMLTTIMENIR